MDRRTSYKSSDIHSNTNNSNSIYYNYCDNHIVNSVVINEVIIATTIGIMKEKNIFSIKLFLFIRSKVIDFGVEKIVYIACKPTSIVRDLEMIQGRGYKADRIACVDLFPETYHIETIALLSSGK